MKLGLRSTLLLVPTIGTALLLLHRVAARETRIPWKLDEPAVSVWRRKQFSGQTSIGFIR